MGEKRLPKRTRAHVLETLSRQHVESIFPPEWVPRRVEDDYGLDMRVEIVTGEEVSGLEFAVQLKGTDHLKTSGDDVLHSCKVSTANYFLHRLEPVMYVVYDAQEDTAYWLWVQPYLHILDNTRPGWHDRKTVQIRIPCSNRLTQEVIQLITRDVQAWEKRELPIVGWPLSAASIAKEKQGKPSVLFLENVGDELWHKGELKQAQSIYLQAVEQAEHSAFDDKVTRARLYRKIGRLHRESGNLDRALEYYENGQTIVKAALPVSARKIEQARLLTEQAAVYIDLGKHQEAVECVQRAVGLLEGSKAASEIGDTMQALAIAYRDAGQRDSFLELMDKARDMYRRVEDIGGEIRIMGNLAIDTLHWGDYQEAIRLFKQVLERLEESPNLAVTANAHLNLAIAYTDAVQLTQALDFAEMSLEEYAEVGDRVGELMACAAFAEVLKERAAKAAQSGNLAAAKDYVGEARRLVNKGLGLADKEDLDVASSLYDLLRIMAEAYLAVGEYERSKEHLAEAEILAQQQEIEPQTHAHGQVAHARLCEVHGDYVQAHRYLEEARNTFATQAYWKNVVPVDILRAEILRRIGGIKEARDVLEKARDLAEMRMREQDSARIAGLLEQLPSP